MGNSEWTHSIIYSFSYENTSYDILHNMVIISQRMTCHTPSENASSFIIAKLKYFLWLQLYILRIRLKKSSYS